MALIRKSAASTFSRDAVVLDLGDLAAQGELLRARARAEADRIVAEARAERDRLIAGAVDEGRRTGIAQGEEEGRKAGQAEGRQAALAETREKLRILDAAWAAALAAFETDRERMLVDARQDVIRLAAAIGELVTKRAVELDPARVTDQIGAVLALLTKPTRLTLAVHPDDRPLVQDALPTLCTRYAAAAHVDLVDDIGLDRGSCTARTGSGGAIDASIRTQLQRIVEILLPAPAPPAEAAPPPEGAA